MIHEKDEMMMEVRANKRFFKRWCVATDNITSESCQDVMMMDDCHIIHANDDHVDHIHNHDHGHDRRPGAYTDIQFSTIFINQSFLASFFAVIPLG